MPKETAEIVEARVGVRIRELREDRGWTQEDLGRRLGGVTWQRVSRIEGGVNMTLASIVKIAGVFELTIVEFFTGLPTARDVRPRKAGRPSKRSP